MKQRYNILLRLFRPVLHMGIIILVFYVMYRIRLFTDLIPGVQLKMPVINYQENMAFGIIAAFAFVVIGIVKDLYELHKPIQRYFQTFSKTWLYRLITITFIWYFGQGFVFFFGISRFIIVVGSFVSFVALFLFDQTRNYLEARRHREGNNKILIVWSDALESYKAIEKIKNGFSFKTEFANHDEIKDIDIAEYFIVVAVGSFEKEVLQNIFERVRFSDNTRFYHISEWFFLEDVVYSPENIDNIIALEYKHSKLDGRSIILKKLFDLGGAFLLTIITLPFMVVIAIAIKIESRGPVFYISKRVGRNGKLFTFLKFRSMYTHMSVGYGGKEADELYQKLIQSDANVRQWILPKIADDPRVTRVGRFLRKTSMDELPQLFCILRWTMSLVGPRPHLPSEVKNYELRQKRLLSIKPGITWYAQVFGRDNLDFEEEAKLDLYYIQNRSLFLDAYIVLATFWVVFKGK
ncbi:MAG: sugar transferase involved in lipopolysaccharide synthesis [uncultured bacterium (gcode 4)]|uniref:Sugar transferase involved in lipopolysaccharide synthesis n=1 Tax=uncultured bacterium (gcode 4) TaxID=1234023 RepID=K1X445_9BACT|nr:MAG: sugar transferase involved in lipopolysaccharide synthesis [uncultured bacterium (gcode 4)]